MNFTQLMTLASGHVEARIVQCAVELGVFDAIEISAEGAPAVALRISTEPRATELLLNALAALQLLDKENGAFALSDIAKRHLVKNSPHYVGAMLQFEAMLWPSWEQLPQAIRTGQPVRSPNMYQDDPHETEIFINAMDALVKARGDTDILASALDWSGVATVLDIGAGPATYAIALCGRFSQLRATIFDLPETLKITQRYIRDAHLEERIELIAGDYRSDGIPGIYDVIFLSNIIHGENDQRTAALFRKLAANLNPSGRLIVKDHVLDDSRVNPPVGALFSLLMLLSSDGGRCYSMSEIDAWMAQAGLSRVEHIDLPPPLTSSLVIGSRK